MPLRNRRLEMGNKPVKGLANAVDAKDAVPKAQMDTAITTAVSGVTPASIGAVPTTRTLTAGTGLSGGGDLSANRSFALANTAVTPGSYTYASITVDQQGRLTAASSGTVAQDFTRSFMTADQTFTANITPADLTGLSFAADASSTYVVRFVLFVTQGAGGLRIDMNTTSALTTGFRSQGFISGAASAIATDETTVGATADYIVEEFAHIVTNGATTISVRGAQQASNAAATTFRKGSYIEYRKIT